MGHIFSAVRQIGVAAVAAAVLPLAAHAAGSDSSEPPAKTKTTMECKDGKVWDKAQEKCVAPKDANLGDDALYQAARELAYSGQYDNALNVLASMSDQSDPRVLNYRGYVYRKTGRFDLGLAYYQKALQADPDYHLARSYMGQGYAEDGKLLLAHAQLVEIRNRGGKDSWAYRALEQTLFDGGSY